MDEHGGQIQVYPRKGGGYDWRLEADNGDILCGSDQGYSRRIDAERMARSIVGGVYRKAADSVVFLQERPI